MELLLIVVICTLAIFLILPAIILLACFIPLFRGRTAFRNVNGYARDDKSIPSNIKSNVNLWVDSKTFNQHQFSQERADFDESITSEINEELASIESVSVLKDDNVK